MAKTNIRRISQVPEEAREQGGVQDQMTYCMWQMLQAKSSSGIQVIKRYQSQRRFKRALLAKYNDFSLKE